jgi:two-component system, chemotaxis family, protein-glutamate methylesterase/glutaminase
MPNRRSLSDVAEQAIPSESQRDLVVIGASAGGVETLKRVVAGLPADLPAAICIVLHIAPDSPSLLAQVLARAGPLPCRAARDDDPLRHGEILVAPPDRHLVVEDKHVNLSAGPRQNRHRPAVDVLFCSAAAAKAGQVIGVVLSGTRGDGTVGLAAVKARGGATIVQDPAEALYAGMPSSALAHVAVDAVVPSGQVAETIVAMVQGDDPPPAAEPRQRQLDPAADHPDASVCPECGGVLTERSEAGITVWECRVGHRYSPEGLVDAQGVDVEAVLRAAIRALEDRARLLERLADQFEPRGQTRSARSFRAKAVAARVQASGVREALANATDASLSRSVDPKPEVEGVELRQAAGGGST